MGHLYLVGGREGARGRLGGSVRPDLLVGAVAPLIEYSVPLGSLMCTVGSRIPAAEAAFRQRTTSRCLNWCGWLAISFVFRHLLRYGA
jgi:hypothetical protein